MYCGSVHPTDFVYIYIYICTFTYHIYILPLTPFPPPCPSFIYLCGFCGLAVPKRSSGNSGKFPRGVPKFGEMVKVVRKALDVTVSQKKTDVTVSQNSDVLYLDGVYGL